MATFVPMYVPFESLHEHSKIWIYPANRRLTKSEADILNERLLAFIKIWVSHNDPVAGSYELINNQILIIGANLNGGQISGCSIDSSVKVIKELEHILNLEFTNRSNLYFLDHNGYKSVALHQLDQSIREGIIHEDSVFVDMSINRFDRFMINKGYQKAGTSFLKRYFN